MSLFQEPSLLLSRCMKMPGWLALLLEPAEETWSTEAVSSDQLEGTEAVVILSDYEHVSQEGKRSASMMLSTGGAGWSID